jgi:hypothetical protein
VGAGFAVADASSSRHVLLAGRLSAAAHDQNPLRPFVWHPATVPVPSWAAAVGPPALVTPKATWGNAIALVTAEFPAIARKGHALTVALTFAVLARPPAGQKLFVHLERPGQPLLNGDHAPVGGDFATEHWRPGDRIRDVYDVDVPLLTTATGDYALSVGFWPGGDTPQRLPITGGSNDGRDRCPLGSLRIE